MNELDHTKREPRKRKGFVFVRLVLRLSKAMLLFFRDKIYDDVVLMMRHSRLFLGILFSTIGIFSFASDRYCDGNTSSYVACTRPATYYYYPWWAIMLILLGVGLLTIWYLRKKR